MKELSDGSWRIDSAYEADRIGRVAAYGSVDKSKTYSLTYSKGNTLSFNNEVAFFNRTLKNGPLIISKTVARQAEIGLIASSVHQLRSEYNSSLIPPKEAAIFLAVLALSREIENPTDVITDAA